MPDYRELYLKMFRASEQAINTLIAAQKECEEIYISSHEPELNIVPLSENSKGTDEKRTPPVPFFNHLLPFCFSNL